MKPASLLVLLSLLWPVASSAQPPFGRQLHYIGTRTAGDERAPVAIDLDIGRADSDEVTWILIDEHVGNRDLGPVHATLDKNGALAIDAARMTVEEQTVLELVALQFEDVDGVDAGDNWDRRAALQGGMRTTHFLVRSASDGLIQFEVTRTLSLGAGGELRGSMSYNSKIAAPTELEFSGSLSGASLAFSMRLAGDSFQPRSAALGF